MFFLPEQRSVSLSFDVSYVFHPLTLCVMTFLLVVNMAGLMGVSLLDGKINRELKSNEIDQTLKLTAAVVLNRDVAEPLVVVKRSRGATSL